jgi:dolichol-phosphate mannosyltransferase
MKLFGVNQNPRSERQRGAVPQGPMVPSQDLPMPDHDAGVSAADVTVVIPCFNEEHALPALLDHLSSLKATVGENWEAVFVDDGSSDGTLRVLQNAAESMAWIRVVKHPRNLGLGAALRTGFAHARSPIVCTIDSDGTCPPEHIPALAALIADGADIAIASPWHPDSELPDCSAFRRVLSHGASIPYRLLLGGDVHSFTCMFRAYRRSALDRVSFRSDGFLGVTEILIVARLRGLKITEIPFRLGVRSQGESKLRILPTILGHLRLVLRTALLLAAEKVGGTSQVAPPGPRS